MRANKQLIAPLRSSDASNPAKHTRSTMNNAFILVGRGRSGQRSPVPCLALTATRPRPTTRSICNCRYCRDLQIFARCQRVQHQLGRDGKASIAVSNVDFPSLACKLQHAEALPRLRGKQLLTGKLTTAKQGA